MSSYKLKDDINKRASEGGGFYYSEWFRDMWKNDRNTILKAEEENEEDAWFKRKGMYPYPIHKDELIKISSKFMKNKARLMK